MSHLFSLLYFFFHFFHISSCSAYLPVKRSAFVLLHRYKLIPINFSAKIKTHKHLPSFGYLTCVS